MDAYSHSHNQRQSCRALQPSPAAPAARPVMLRHSAAGGPSTSRCAARPVSRAQAAPSSTGPWRAWSPTLRAWALCAPPARPCPTSCRRWAALRLRLGPGFQGTGAVRGQGAWACPHRSVGRSGTAVPCFPGHGLVQRMCMPLSACPMHSCQLAPAARPALCLSYSTGTASRSAWPPALPPQHGCPRIQ